MLGSLTLMLTAILTVQSVNAQSGEKGAQPLPGQDRLTQAGTPEKDEAQSLSDTIAQLYRDGRYKEALPLAQRVLEIREKTLGEQHPLVTNALNNLAVLYQSANEAKKAEPLFERILTLRERGQGPSSAATLASLESYLCLVGSGGWIKRNAVLKLDARIHKILLQDDIIAAGMPVPADLTAISGATVKRDVPPSYPALAKQARASGVVTLLVELDETGRVINLTPLRPCGVQDFLVASAMEAARKTEFTPTVVNGKPIKRMFYRSYTFVIQ